MGLRGKVFGRKTFRVVGPSFIIALLAIWGAASAGLTASADAATLPLQDAIKLPDQTIDSQKSVDLALPPLSAKPGKIIVLHLRTVSYFQTEAGCNLLMALQVNGTPVSRFVAGGGERLIGRPTMFEFVRGNKDFFPIFNGPLVMVLFAPDVETGDRMTKDGMGATFTLDISDLARGVDGNTLTIRNVRQRTEPQGRYDLIVRNIEVGWADKAALPRPPSAVPARGELASHVSAGPLRLAVGGAGGFSVVRTGSPELMVETALGMGPNAISELTAEGAQAKASPQVMQEPFGPVGYRLTAVWPRLKLVRTVEIKGDLVEWKERWTNTGNGIAGVPFRHRLFLRDTEGRYLLSGDPELDAFAGCGQNPTIFIEDRRHEGSGLGVVLESDWLRLLSGFRSARGLVEIYSDTMALAPKSSCDFFLTITPVSSGGYWSFINSVRNCWGSNRDGQATPIFWGYVPGGTEESVRKALGHLGPVTVAIGPWARLQPDAAVVADGAYPKLAADAPRAPGGCPDLDVEKFLTFQHREPYWRQLAADVALIHNACPGVRVIEFSHPAMEMAYQPMAERWPYASEEILTAEGKPFEDASYSRSWAHEMVSKGWAVYYYVPRPGSEYLKHLLASERRALDECGCDGMYWDEFSWAFTRRDYSRYDYSRWDGHSADLDPQGNVIRLKCDNGWITETAQLAIVQECLLRGKFFLGNGAASLRDVNSLPIAHFEEGGNGYGYMANGHLSSVPLVLGNFGERKTRKDLFDSVKSALSIGCIYSPLGEDSALLEGPDNFVCKQYPLTIRELGAGVIAAEERLITTKSGAFDWPGRAASVRLYIYDEKGGLTGKDTVLNAEAGKPLALTVPKDGLVIAEVGL